MEAIQKVENHDLRLVALNPGQLASCQSQLIAWAESKVRSERERVEELSQNFAAAQVHGLRTTTIEKHLNAAAKRVVFYSKIGEAVKAGYYIIPNMPMDVFAIRTNRKDPKHQYVDSAYSHRELDPEKSKLLPAGEGEYRNPLPGRYFQTETRKNDKGVDVKHFLTIIDGYRDEIDFPFALAKPEVLNATTQAMALKLFDEIGVMPATNRADPMVIGTIFNPSDRWRGRRLSFLIAWFLDTDTI